MDDGEDKKRRRRSQRSYPHWPRTDRVYGIGICPITLTPTRCSHQESAARTADPTAMRSNFLGNLLGRLPDDMTLAYHYQRRTASSDLT